MTQDLSDKSANTPHSHIKGNMAYAVVENCPLTLKDWTSRSSLKCSSVNTYHCVADEFSRIVEVCTTPLWIEKGILLKIISIFIKTFCQ